MRPGHAPRPCPVAAVLALVVGLVLSGCAGLPGSGPVVRADDVVPSLDVVTYEPAPPAEGAGPEEIVAGFLDAMLAYPVSTAVASQYLTPDAVDSWASSDGVRIYRSPQISLRQVDDATARVDLGLDETGALDATGRYRSPLGAGPVDVGLEQVDGEWRIAAPPPGMLVTQTYFDTYYDVFDVYSFDLLGERLLADPVHVPVGDQLATALMGSLAAGPPPALAGEARTYLPPPEQWRPAVTVGAQGVAEIELDLKVSALEIDVRRRLSAQVVRTLAQVPGVEGIRILGTDGPLVVGDTPVQPTTAWRRFDPATPEGRPAAVSDGQVVTIVGDDVTPLPDQPEDLATDVVRLAVGQRGVATVTSAGVLRVALRDGSEVRDVAESVIGLAWDPTGQLWVADAPGGALRVRTVSAGGVQPVDTDPLETSSGDAGAVVSFALDAGGRRYAVVRAGGPVLVGAVDRNGPVTVLRGGSPVAPDVPSPAAVAWTGPTEVAVLGTDGSGGQVYRAPIDGSPSDGFSGRPPVLPTLVVDGLAAGPGADPGLYVTDDQRRLWYLPPGGAWRVLDLTAAVLSSGR